MMRIPFSYIWRSLWARRLTTALTVGGVALVVFVFAGVLMLARGLEATLIETGSPANVIVLRRSATSELSSQVDRATADVLAGERDRKSTRLNSSHGYISYGVLCLNKKTEGYHNPPTRLY